MSLSAKREALARIHGRYQRAGRPHKTRIPAEVLPVLKTLWLASDQLCSKLLKAALPEWPEHDERRSAVLPEAFKE